MTALPGCAVGATSATSAASVIVTEIGMKGVSFTGDQRSGDFPFQGLPAYVQSIIIIFILLSHFYFVLQTAYSKIIRFHYIMNHFKLGNSCKQFDFY